VVLATLLVADRRHRIAHAILIDGKVACLVEGKTAADQVRKYLLSSAVGGRADPPAAPPSASTGRMRTAPSAIATC